MKREDKEKKRKEDTAPLSSYPGRRPTGQSQHCIVRSQGIAFQKANLQGLMHLPDEVTA